MLNKIFRYKIVDLDEPGRRKIQLTDIPFSFEGCEEFPKSTFEVIKLVRWMRKDWYDKAAWEEREMAALDREWAQGVIDSINEFYVELRTALENKDVEAVRACVKRTSSVINKALISQDLPRGGFRSFSFLGKGEFKGKLNNITSEELAAIKGLIK